MKEMIFLYISNFERGEKVAVCTSEKTINYLRSGGDMIVEFDEDVIFPLTIMMQKQLNGEYKVL